MRFRIAALPLVLLLAAALVGCGGSSTDSASSSEATSASSASSTQSASSGEVDRTITLHPKGNQMKYRETEFTVAPGQTIELVFENTATSPSMQHNVVVLNSTEDDVFRRVGEAGMQAGSANDYVPEDDAIIAYTPMSKPGETVSVTFTVPEETGDYGYVCTFPGHWATMQGTMRVEESAA
ncbi:MAG: plastocyanin/azurin family copper-binding protein [Salinivenus sp.]